MGSWRRGLHIYDAAGGSITLRPESGGRLELGSVTNGPVAVSVFRWISCHSFGFFWLIYRNAINVTPSRDQNDRNKFDDVNTAF